MEGPSSESGHFIRVNRRRMVQPAGDIILEPPTKYILKLKLKKKKKQGKHSGGILSNMNFHQAQLNIDIKKHLLSSTQLKFSTFPNNTLAFEVRLFAQNEGKHDEKTREPDIV